MKIYALICLLLLGLASGYPVTKNFTYVNDIEVSTTGDVTIMGPSNCDPFMGFIEEGHNQTFECRFENATQESDNAIMFTFPIREFPHFSFAGCFAAEYPCKTDYQLISTC